MHDLDACMKFMIYSIETVQLAGLSQVNKRHVVVYCVYTGRVRNSTVRYSTVRYNTVRYAFTFQKTCAVCVAWQPGQITCGLMLPCQ